MYNNIESSFSLINGGGGNYELEYINEGYASIQSVKGACTASNCSTTCSGTCYGNCTGGCLGCGNCDYGCTGCTGDCAGTCSGCSGCSNCTGSCYGCSGSCEGCTSCSGGCSGCSGCGNLCSNNCSGTCKNTCQGTCTGAGATVSIDGVNKNVKIYTSISNIVKRSSNQYFSINGIIKKT